VVTCVSWRRPVVTSERSDSGLISGHWPHIGQDEAEFGQFDGVRAVWLLHLNGGPVGATPERLEPKEAP